MSEQRLPVIECYSFPAIGHAIALFRIVDILQKCQRKLNVYYTASQYFIQRMQPKYPHIKMVAIKDGMTRQSWNSQRSTYGAKALPHYIFKANSKYFAERQQHPDVIICDIFSQAAMNYARRNNIKCIVNTLMAYEFSKQALNWLDLQRSFGLGGFTVCYPPLYDQHFMKKQFSLLQKAMKGSKLLINSSISFERPTVVPTHHIFTGFLTNRNKEVPPMEKDMQEWVNAWKNKGKKKFLYLAFGTQISVSENFLLKIQAAIQKSGYPTVWVLENDHGKIKSELIFYRNWVSQEAVLGSKQFQGFFTHCGWGSTTEGVLYQMPMLCLPVFGDQPFNADLVVRNKLGLKLLDKQLTCGPKLIDPPIEVDQIAGKLQRLMQEDSFRTNVARVGAICKRQRADIIVKEAVLNTLDFGNAYLVDQDYEDAIARNTLSNIKIVVFLVVLLLIWFGSHYFFARSEQL